MGKKQSKPPFLFLMNYLKQNQSMITGKKRTKVGGRGGGDDRNAQYIPLKTSHLLLPVFRIHILKMLISNLMKL